ncbi:hypothetical protein R1sor_027017 [Riccia sorocarpa]|uniref:Helicase C-terminal domain-containing protein n=1 Tax=Riccia sorocarpa TaxID=122646 RepID=A0ABD3GF64_9MARC
MGLPYGGILADDQDYANAGTVQIVMDSGRALPPELQIQLLDLLETNRDICPLCNDPPDDAMVCICTHIFCRQCISEQLASGLKKANFSCRRLDGTMSVLARDRAVTEFKTLPEVTVIIMSLKAASLGLNMVAACHVLLLDVWWNPTTEDQAIDRAHRIGKIRLSVRNTIEDRILDLQVWYRDVLGFQYKELARSVDALSREALAELWRLTASTMRIPGLPVPASLLMPGSWPLPVPGFLFGVTTVATLSEEDRRSLDTVKRLWALTEASLTRRAPLVDAVAVVARFPDDCCEDLVDYRQGQSSEYPALALLPFDHTISPRSAAEEIGLTFLPCVLVGLSRAPQYVSKAEQVNHSKNGTLRAPDVDCVVVPVNTCGGDGTLSFARRTGGKPLIIAVEENETVLQDTPEKVGIDALRVANYWEALGVMAAHNAGVNPKALRRDGVGHLRKSYNYSPVSLNNSSKNDLDGTSSADAWNKDAMAGARGIQPLRSFFSFLPRDRVD